MQFYSRNACVKPVLIAPLVLLLLGGVPAPAGAEGLEDRTVPMQREQGCPLILSLPGQGLWSIEMLHRCGEGLHSH